MNDDQTLEPGDVDANGNHYYAEAEYEAELQRQRDLADSKNQQDNGSELTEQESTK